MAHRRGAPSVPGVSRSGLVYQDAPAESWSAVLREVAMAGFDHVDLTDSWLRPGDLTPDRRDDLVRALKDDGLSVTAISMDVGIEAEENTDYPHIAVVVARKVADGNADRALLISSYETRVNSSIP